ncbi:MAG: serine/threonine-protein kinase [Myxococcota bacterium]
MSVAPPPRSLGRYALGPPIASGGMASVHLGLLSGPVGFKRTVAIKRMHAALASDATARATLIDEARVTSRIHHPHVVQTLDVIEDQGELFLVLEYVHGASLDQLLARARATGPLPTRIVSAVLAGVLRGLHAAHEARGEDGHPLELVHRDLSPHNVMVDSNGVPRVLDFGIARARGRLQGTREGQLKGKLAYLSPEQVHGDASRRSDVFAAGVVLFEALTGRQLFDAPSEAALLSQVLLCRVPTLASLGVDAPALQAVLDRALQRDPADRYPTAAAMADELEATGVASAAELASWVQSLAGEQLAERSRAIEALERVELTPAAPRVVAPSQSRRVWLLIPAVLAAAGGAWWLASSRTSNAARPDAGSEVLVPDAGVEVPVVDAGPPLDAGTPTVPDAGVRAKAPVPKAAKKKACDPPYVIDASGVKRYKVECLE